MRSKFANIVSVVAVLVCLLLSAGQSCAADSTNAPAAAKIDETFVIGKVKTIESSAVDKELEERTGIVSRKQIVQVEILEGPLKGKTVVIPNEVTDNPAYNVTPKPGQEIILSVAKGNGKTETYISDYHRAPALLLLTAIFLAVFLFFGGKQGFKSLAGLLICLALVFLVLLPASLHGYNPLLIAVITCLLACGTTMFFVAGFSRKAVSAALGTILGVIIAGVAAQAVITYAPLTGLTSEEAQILRGAILQQPAEFYSGLLAAGMLIGALGVIMDVGISIASAVSEVARTDPSLTVAQLYKSGMNVGRDIMGTMTTTLVLAYAGGALPLLMLVVYMPSVKLINLDLVATEFTAALTGSLGLITTIPITAFIAAELMGKGGRASKQETKKAVSGDPFDHLAKVESLTYAKADDCSLGKSK